MANAAKLPAGGKRDGSLYAPTVLSNTGNDMKVCNPKALAPIVAIEAFDDFNRRWGERFRSGPRRV